MTLLVRQPGLMTSLQDLGRQGHLAQGVPPSGALDCEGLMLANALAGNSLDKVALEMIGHGPTLEVEANSLRIALVGFVQASLDGRPLASWRSHLLSKGQLLKLGQVEQGHVAYLAVAGGFDGPSALGSHSTYLRAGMGQRLEPGKTLALHLGDAPPGALQQIAVPSNWICPRLRVVEGPEMGMLGKKARADFFKAKWRISDQADRMGIRLDGPRLVHNKSSEIAPAGLVRGCIQVPGDGRPILLLADHQTTGGYPRVACVITADLPLSGRLAPKSEVCFESVTWAEAKTALTDRKAAIQALLSSIRPMPGLDLDALSGVNLVSGAVDALALDDVP
jgi:biotin-dependent carboxylase-like uncharacterized protein